MAEIPSVDMNDIIFSILTGARNRVQIARKKVSEYILVNIDKIDRFTVCLITSSCFAPDIQLPQQIERIEQTNDTELHPLFFRVHTIINGVLECNNIAHEGDYLICGPQQEIYVLTKEKFDNSYELKDNVYKNKVHNRSVIKIVDGDLANLGEDERSFIAPWNEKMIIEPDDYIAFENDANIDDLERGKECIDKKYYRIHRDAFVDTWEIIY
eukprot:gene10109-13585_t